MDILPDIPRARDSYKCGSHAEKHKTLCAVSFPFQCKDENNCKIADFNIGFDVIDGEFSFLIGLPALFAMSATMNFKYKSLGVIIGSRYVRISLSDDDSHMNLPFSSTIYRIECNGSGPANDTTSQYTSSPHQSPDEDPDLHDQSQRDFSAAESHDPFE